MGARTRWVRSSLAILVAASASPPVAGAQVRTVHLTVEASATDGCASVGELESAVERLLGREAIASQGADLDVDVHIQRAESGEWIATVVGSAVEGASGERILRAPGGDCRGLDEALALVVALMVDPDAVAAAEPPRPAEPESRDPDPGEEEFDDVWEQYHDAVMTLAHGHQREAAWVLRQIVSEHPDHAAAERASMVLSAIESSHAEEVRADAGRPVTGRAVWRADPDRETIAQRRERRRARMARAELVLHQGVFSGMGIGAELCLMGGCNVARGWLLAMSLGAAPTTVLTMTVTRRLELDRGVMHAANAGYLLGLFNGWALASTVGLYEQQRFSFSDSFQRTRRFQRGLSAGLLTGHLSGLGLGIAAGLVLEPSPGQVGMALSGATWAGAAAAITVGGVRQGGKWGQGAFAFIWLTSGAGLTAAGLAAAGLPEVSRGRLLVVDLATLAGFGTGAGIAAAIDSSEGGPIALTSVLVGASGFTLSWMLTRDYDGPADPDTSVSVVPTEGGAQAMLRLRLR